MRVGLELHDQIQLLPVLQLYQLLKLRNFCSDDETRQRVADAIGSSRGTVDSIEDKYAFDYFYFKPEGKTETYSIPYQAVDFNQAIVNHKREIAADRLNLGFKLFNLDTDYSL